jgi:hypothetical protein
MKTRLTPELRYKANRIKALELMECLDTLRHRTGLIAEHLKHVTGLQGESLVRYCESQGYSLIFHLIFGEETQAFCPDRQKGGNH